MKHRILATTHALLFAGAFLVACSKDGAIGERSEEQQLRSGDAARVSGIENPGYAPMPVDTMELDSLDRPGFQ